MSMLIKGFNVANAEMKIDSPHHGDTVRSKLAIAKERFAVEEQKRYAELYSKEEWCCDRATD
jgi:hypothetical protein